MLLKNFQNIKKYSNKENNKLNDLKIYIKLKNT